MAAGKSGTPLQRITAILSLTAAAFSAVACSDQSGWGEYCGQLYSPYIIPEIELDCDAQEASNLGCPDVDIEVQEIEPPDNKE